MNRLFKIGILLAFVSTVWFGTANAYEIPQRKIEVKPYLYFLSPNDLGESTSQPRLVENKSSFGIGLKLRTQFSGRFGIVLNTAYSKFEVTENTSDDGAIFTGGGYYSRSFEFGTLTLDLGYGIIIAADKALGLVMPSLEYSRSISERMSVAFEFGLPIHNDWPKDFGYKESIGSFTLSAGLIIVF